MAMGVFAFVPLPASVWAFIVAPPMLVGTQMGVLESVFTGMGIAVALAGIGCGVAALVWHTTSTSQALGASGMAFSALSAVALLLSLVTGAVFVDNDVEFAALDMDTESVGVGESLNVGDFSIRVTGAAASTDGVEPTHVCSSM